VTGAASSGGATPADDTPGGNPLGEHPLGAATSGLEVERLQAALQQRLFGRGPAATVGRYNVLQPLGHGGMGVVYAAYDPQLDRKVALKVMRPDRSGPEDRARLLREARALARLNHPNVVTVYEVGELEDGDVFIAMEFLGGGTLAQWIDAHAGAPEHWREVVAMFCDVGQGLVAAHAAGLVHRDFKPLNVLLGGDGRPRVADFGLARPTTVPAGDGTTPRTARASTLAGTPGYMIAMSHAGAELDERSDQYGFCVALHEALFGMRPELDETGQVMVATRASEVPTVVNEALLRGLARRRDDRFGGLAVLLAELQRSTAGQRRSAAIALVAIAGLVVGVAVAGAGETHPPPAPLPCAEERAAVARAWPSDPSGGDAIEAGGSAVHRAGTRLHRALVDQLDLACEASTEGPLRCLRRGALQLQAIHEAVEAGRVQPRRAMEAIAELADPSMCNDPARRASEPPLPSDAAHRAEVTAMRDEVASARVEGLLGREAEARDVTEAVLARATASGQQPVVAESELLLGSIASRAGRGEAAAAALERAILAAEAGRHDWVKVHAGIVRAGVLALQLGQFEQADATLAMATAGLARLGTPPELAEEAATTRGIIAYARARPEAAVRHLSEAVAMIEARRGPDAFGLVRPANALGAAAASLGRIEEARAAFERVRTVIDAHYGREHPLYGRALINLGVAARDDEDLDAAVEYLSEALERTRAAFGDAHASVAVAAHNLAAVHIRRGEHDQARTLAGEAVAIAERAHGKDSPELRWSLATLAHAQSALGDHAVAQASIDRADRLVIAAWGERAVQRLKVLMARAYVLEQAGRAADADAADALAREIAAEQGADLPPALADD